jgi:long-chain acyl-CoA synthetase
MTDSSFWASEMPFIDLLAKNDHEQNRSTMVECFDGHFSRSEILLYRNALAHFLSREHGISAGDRIILTESCSRYYLVALTAIAAIGAIAVPVGAAWQHSALKHIERSTTPSLAISFIDSPQLPLDTPEILISEKLFVEIHLIDDLPQNNFLDRITASSVCMILFTTGSTGTPKGVAISYQNHLAALTSISKYLEYPHGSRILLTSSPAFDYGLYQYALAIYSGSTVVVAKRPAFPIDLLEIVATKNIEILPLVPSQWREIAQKANKSQITLQNIGTATSTGSLIDSTLMNEILRLVPNAKFFSMYGLTECKRVSYLSPELAQKKPTSVGKPMTNCVVELVDEQGKEVFPGSIGELIVRGPHVASGYWGLMEDYESSFHRDSTTGEITLRTGDFFKQDSEGDLYFCGRRDDLVKINDIRISLAEVDRTLLQLPFVLDAISYICIRNGRAVLSAQIVANSDNSHIQIQRELMKRGVISHLIPKDIVFVTAIRKNANGKPIRPSSDWSNSHSNDAQVQ